MRKRINYEEMWNKAKREKEEFVKKSRPFYLLKDEALSGNERAKFVIDLIISEANFMKDEPIKNESQRMAMSICLHFGSFIDFNGYLEKINQYDTNARDSVPKKPKRRSPAQVASLDKG